MENKVNVTLYGNVLTHVYKTKGAFITETYEVAERKEMWRGELPFSFLQVGDTFYIKDIDKVVNISERIKSSNCELIFHTDYVIEKLDENNEKRLLEAERRVKNYMDWEIKMNTPLPITYELPKWIKKLFNIK